ncbi:hypothetical protein D3C73_1074420 [compost metagenome]
MQGDRQDEKPDSIDALGFRPAPAAFFMFVRNKSIEADHQCNTQRQSQHHDTGRQQTVTGEFLGRFDARQDERERTGSQHHPCSEAKHDVLSARRNIAQCKRDDSPHGCRSKARQPTKKSETQIVLVGPGESSVTADHQHYHHGQ